MESTIQIRFCHPISCPQPWIIPKALLKDSYWVFILWNVLIYAFIKLVKGEERWWISQHYFWLVLRLFVLDLLTRPRGLIWRCGLVCMILHKFMYLFFTCIGKGNNATVTYFLKFMSIYCTFHLNFVFLLPLRLSCVFLA